MSGINNNNNNNNNIKTHISLSERYNIKRTATTLGVFKRVGIPSDLKPMLSSYTDLEQGNVKHVPKNISNRIDNNLHGVLNTVGPSFEKQKA